jgi:hypothetical protein
VDEVLTSIRRAGADIVLSYWAQEWAERYARRQAQGAWVPSGLLSPRPDPGPPRPEPGAPPLPEPVEAETRA